MDRPRLFPLLVAILRASQLADLEGQPEVTAVALRIARESWRRRRHARAGMIRRVATTMIGHGSQLGRFRRELGLPCLPAAESAH